jgi:hypothetical protein
MDVVELSLDLQDQLGREVDVLAVYRSVKPAAVSPLRPSWPRRCRCTHASGDERPVAPDDRDRRLLRELRRSLAFVRSYVEGGEASFMRNEMAVDAVKYRLGEPAALPELKEGHRGVR